MFLNRGRRVLYVLHDVDKFFEIPWNDLSRKEIVTLANQAVTDTWKDSSFWTMVEQRAIRMRLSGSALTNLAECFQTIDYAAPLFWDHLIYAEERYDNRKGKLNSDIIPPAPLRDLDFYDLARLTEAYAKACGDSPDFLFEKISPELLRRSTGDGDEKRLLNWLAIVCSYAKCGAKDVAVFERAAFEMVPAVSNLRGKKVVALVEAFAHLRMKHLQLFNALADILPGLSLRDDEVVRIAEAFKQLGYHNKKIDILVQFRQNKSKYFTGDNKLLGQELEST